MIKQHLTLALGFTQIALLVSVAAYRKEVSLPCMFINGTPDFHFHVIAPIVGTNSAVWADYMETAAVNSHVIAPIVGTNSVLSGLIISKQQR